MQQRHLLKRVEFLLGLWTLLVQFVKKREANTGLELSNKSKTTYTALAAIMLNCISWGTKEQGVPMGFCALGANQKTPFGVT